jgi:hypothetical protein
VWRRPVPADIADIGHPVSRPLLRDYRITFGHRSVADEFSKSHSEHLGLHVQLRLTVGYCLATNSLSRQCWRQIDRLDDCVVNPFAELGRGLGQPNPDVFRITMVKSAVDEDRVREFLKLHPGIP